MKDNIKDSCVFRGEWWRSLRYVTAQDRYDILTAFFSQIFEGSIPDHIPNYMKTTISPWLEAVERDKERYKETCEKRRNSINKRWKNKEDNDQVSRPKKKSSEDIFTPPTAEQVQAYCDEYNIGIDGTAFVDYYESIGWKVGKNQMRNWMAAVRWWEKNPKFDDN